MTQIKMKISDDSCPSFQSELPSEKESFQKESEPQLAIHPLTSKAYPMHMSPPPPWQQQVKRCIDTIASPLSAVSSAIGLHGFTPLPLEREIVRAAEVLTSFTCPNTNPANDTVTISHCKANAKARQYETIPASEIKSAVGIIILTTGRVGLRRVSGSAGSGILLLRDMNTSSEIKSGSENEKEAKNKTQNWYAPVGIRSYGAGAGPFAVGMQVTERVYILSSHEAVSQFMRAGWLLGPEASLAAGRICKGGGVAFAASLSTTQNKNTGSSPTAGLDVNNTGGSHECPKCGHSEPPVEAHQGGDGQPDKDFGAGVLRESLRHPIQCYMRSTGLYVGLQAEASILEERTHDNASFYGQLVSVFSGPKSLKEVEANIAPEKLASLKHLLDVLSRAESGEVDKLE